MLLADFYPGDVWGVTLFIIGFLLSLQGLWLVCRALWPERVEAAAAKCETHRVSSFFTGLGIMFITILVGVGAAKTLGARADICLRDPVPFADIHRHRHLGICHPYWPTACVSDRRDQPLASDHSRRHCAGICLSDSAIGMVWHSANLADCGLRRVGVINARPSPRAFRGRADRAAADEGNAATSAAWVGDGIAAVGGVTARFQTSNFGSAIVGILPFPSPVVPRFLEAACIPLVDKSFPLLLARPPSWRWGMRKTRQPGRQSEWRKRSCRHSSAYGCGDRSDPSSAESRRLWPVARRS